MNYICSSDNKGGDFFACQNQSSFPSLKALPYKAALKEELTINKLDSITTELNPNTCLEKTVKSLDPEILLKERKKRSRIEAIQESDFVRGSDSKRVKTESADKILDQFFSEK